MKKTVLLFFTCCTIALQAQTAGSSCTGPDSIVRKYRKDADRLALQRTFKINSGYKDSIRINKTLSDFYLRALIAVYNATAIPARDTVVKMLNIHTAPSPEMNSVSLKASGSLPWMVNLSNYVVPVGQINIDDLMSRYYLQIGTYYQSTLADVVVFNTDSSCNMTAMAKNMKTISGVVDAEPGKKYNDVTHISDSVNTAFTELTYSYGWGSCADGCDRRAYWTFRIYSDCSVEFRGGTGEPLYTGIASPDADLQEVSVWPNPAQDQVYISTTTADKVCRASISNTLGKVLLTGESSNGTLRLDTSVLPAGIYLVELESGGRTKQTKLLKL